MAFGDYAIFPQMSESGGLVNISALKTNIIYPTLTSGTESNYAQRRKLWTRTVREYELDCRALSNAAADQVIAFLLAADAGVDPFLFRDPRFYQMTAVAFGTGDGDAQLFQLKTVNTFSTLLYTQNATYIKTGTLSVYKDAVLTTAYSYDQETGAITFDAAPALGVALTATFQFYFKVILANPIALMRGTVVSSDAAFTFREVVE